MSRLQFLGSLVRRLVPVWFRVVLLVPARLKVLRLKGVAKADLLRVRMGLVDAVLLDLRYLPSVYAKLSQCIVDSSGVPGCSITCSSTDTSCPGGGCCASGLQCDASRPGFCVGGNNSSSAATQAVSQGGISF